MQFNRYLNIEMQIGSSTLPFPLLGRVDKNPELRITNSELIRSISAQLAATCVHNGKYKDAAAAPL